MARKILLADDSVTAQNMGRRILADAGYEVVTVNNGSAALKKIAELEPELIVLDVYMPGYSGLEVCQRVKAAPETAAIPILLTVGKLEPFKADEAKKVFADAFIIKPFEATELLAALTKLEEKIVPQKATKAASAKATPVKEAAKKEKPQPAQEDQEWKDRLRIQATPVQAKEPEPPAPIVSQFHDIRHEIAAAETDEAISRNLPGDVTSEELAAITAAVTAFSVESDAAYEPAPIDEVQAYAPAEEVARHEELIEAEHHVAEQEPGPAEEVEQSEETKFLKSISPWANPVLLEEVAAALKGPIAEEVDEPEEEPDQPEVAVAPPATPADGFTDSDVDAALASLSSLDTPDIMSRLHAEEQAREHNLDHVDAQAAESWSEEPATIGSTRWIAEEMKLEESEASLVLEEEMQTRARRHAIAGGSRGDRRSAHRNQSKLSPENCRSEGPAAIDAVSSIEVPEAQPEFVAEVASAEIDSIEAASTEVAAAEAATIEIPEQLNSYAAAASAGVSPSPSYAEASPVESVNDPESGQPDPELAEAWARWRQIRELVASPQFVEQVADVAAAEIAETAQAQEPALEPKAPQAEDFRHTRFSRNREHCG